MDKKQLSERNICSKFITPAIQKAGWDLQTQVREELYLTKGRVIVSGQLHTRDTGKHKAQRADYVLFYKPNMPIAVIEAKVNTLSRLNGASRASRKHPTQTARTASQSGQHSHCQQRGRRYSAAQ